MGPVGRGITFLSVAVAGLILFGGVNADNNQAQPFKPAQPATYSPPPPQIFILARKPDYPDRYARCEIDLVMLNRSSKVVTMSGTVQGFSKGGSDGTGYFRFEFVEPGKDKWIKARIDTYCDSSYGLGSVIVREINSCKLSGDYYRDCGTITAPGGWLPDVKGPIPLTIDLK